MCRTVFFELGRLAEANLRAIPGVGYHTVLLSSRAITITILRASWYCIGCRPYFDNRAIASSYKLLDSHKAVAIY
jgi:hypothetical protein